jgi:chlorobactene glucosyltransferase
VEDVWLARRIKEFGHRLVIRDGASLVSCRMYRSLRDVWQGFSKNLFAGFGYSLAAITTTSLALFLTSVLPFVFAAGVLVAGGTNHPAFPFLAGQVALLLGIRLLTALRFRMPLWSALLHPFAILIFLGIAVNSCRWVLLSGGARWKGRTYDFRPRSIV